MEELTKIEKNKSLAKFLCMWEAEKDYYYNVRLERAFKLEEMEFDSDWNWIMDIVEKISDVCTGNERLNVWWNIAGVSDVRICRLSKQETIDSCLEFIEFYNQVYFSDGIIGNQAFNVNL